MYIYDITFHVLEENISDYYNKTAQCKLYFRIQLVFKLIFESELFHKLICIISITKFNTETVGKHKFKFNMSWLVLIISKVLNHLVQVG